MTLKITPNIWACHEFQQTGGGCGGERECKTQKGKKDAIKKTGRETL